MLSKENIFRLIPFKEALGFKLVSHYFEHPIFLVGSGRSGTTALALAMNQHPHIDFSVNEAALSMPLSSMVGSYHSGHNNEWQKGNVMLDKSSFRDQMKKLLFESVWGPYYGLRRNLGWLQGAWSRAKSTQHWGTKVFPTKTGFEGMNWMFPNAKYIFLIRNGIDVVASMQKFPGFQDMTFKECCEFWAKTVDYYEYLRYEERAITIRFEDFLTDRENVFKKIQNEFGIDHSDEPSLFASTTVVHPQDKQTMNEDPLKVFSTRTPVWDTWSKDQKSVFREVCGAAMQTLDYNTPPLTS